MEYSIVGFNESKGVYEGHNYHKLKLHCLGEPKGDIAGGKFCEVVSFNVDDASNLYELCAGKLEGLIGLVIEVYYDKYGKPMRAFPE